MGMGGSSGIRWVGMGGISGMPWVGIPEDFFLEVGWKEVAAVARGKKKG